ncbi:MAG: TMEM165/GDT1 family protein [Acetobacteraceae bacterium]|nr:TMEM165/GDT1 family protein [Acetobacteraceae bacterium]
MSWKVLSVTFGLVFLAELGDKTQLATMMLSAQSRSPVSVFLGAALALVLTSLVGVAVGGVIGRLVPARYIQIGAGVLFVVLGGLLIAGKS